MGYYKNRMIEMMEEEEEEKENLWILNKILEKKALEKGLDGKEKEKYINDKIEKYDLSDVIYEKEYHNFLDDYEEILEEERNNRYEEEYSWYDTYNQTEQYEEFLIDMRELEAIVRSQDHILIPRMACSYSVTLMETFLQDSLKAKIRENEKYVENAAKNINELKERNYKLIDVIKEKDNVKNIVLDQLSEYMYHNISKIINVYSVVFDKKIKVDMEEINKVVDLRHDIVHRNGKKKDGTDNEINKETVLRCIEVIIEFISQVHEVLRIA